MYVVIKANSIISVSNLVNVVQSWKNTDTSSDLDISQVESYTLFCFTVVIYIRNGEKIIQDMAL
jgi:hypothetical protein